MGSEIFRVDSLPDESFEAFPWTTRNEIVGMDDRSLAFKWSNRTLDAEQGRNRWFQNYNANQTFIVMLCGDSRERIAFPPDYIIDLSTIAASGPTEPYAKMFNDPRPGAVVTANHYDGASFDPSAGYALIGCGGIHARAHMEETRPNRKPKRGIGRYATKTILDKDAAYNSVKNGAVAATLTRRPVLAGVHDHRYGIFTPLAYFQNSGTSEMSESVIPQADLYYPERYNPEQFYANGIPSLPENHLPDVFKHFLEKQREYTQQLQTEYPDLHERLGTQNPDYLFITTEKVPTRLRYPQLLRDPGSFFQIHIPRAKNGSSVFVDEDSIELALEQAEYPIDVAKFSNLHTIVIETGSILESRKIAEALMQAKRHTEDDEGNLVEVDGEPWILDWHLRNPNGQILLGQSNRGVTTQIELYNWPDQKAA